MGSFISPSAVIPKASMASSSSSFGARVGGNGSASCKIAHLSSIPLDLKSTCAIMPQGLSYVPHIYLYLYFAIYISYLAYVYHWTALPLILDISAISILSCFRFTDTSWLTCLFGSHFPCSHCPFNSYLPLLFLACVSHFYSYDSDLFCSLLSTILHISQPSSSFLACLLGSL